MGVREAGRRLREVGNGPLDEDTWHRESEAFAAALAAEDDPEEIRGLLAEDETDDLPIAAKTAAFQRLLALGVRTPEVLRAFADHLWFHGPQDDDRAAELSEEADRLEAAGGH